MDPITTAEAGGTIVAGLAAVSKPAEALIQRVSDALGTLYEPTRIKRAAQAEVEAEKIRAIGRCEISEIEQRGLLRMIREQGRIQQNIESITQKAAEHLSVGAHPEKLNDDWINLFFDKCKLISDDEMQRVWAKILAEQSNQRSFSKKTLELVSTLEKTDAELFTLLCGFVWKIPNSVPLILDCSKSFYSDRGADYSNLKHLESLGLISYIQFGYHQAKCPSPSVFSYSGGNLKLIFPNEQERDLQLGQVLFTQAGLELASICKSKAIGDLPEFVATLYREQGIIAEWELLSV